MAEALGIDELARVIHAAAAQVQRHRREAGPGQPLGECGPQPPVLEALESMHHHGRRPRAVSAPRSHIDEDVAEGAGEAVAGQGRSCH